MRWAHDSLKTDQVQKDLERESAHRRREFDEAGLEVFARQHSEVLVDDLAALKLAVEEVAHHAWRRCDHLQKVPFLHLCMQMTG